MSRPGKLLSFHFVSLCLLIFLTYCNTTAFYNLYLYLQQIGIPQAWRGFLIGCSALSTITFFLFASPYLNARNAVRWASAGALVMLACGPVYLFAESVPAILAVRLANGMAVYLLSSACMTLMVSRIRPELSGRAFSLYSVAQLLPYSIVPAVCDELLPHLPSAAYEYQAMSLLFVPGLVLLFAISRSQAQEAAPAGAAARISLAEMYRNAASPPIAMVLLLNTLYIVAFSSLFFMAKGLFKARGYADVGYYFSIQTCSMICIRAFGNRLFDRMRKVSLIRFTFLMTAVSFVLAARSTALWQLYASSLAMGIGMGFGSPALYSLVFSISPPRFKAINSNLMMLSLQIGNFLGPVFGSWTMHRAGYDGLLMADAAMCLLGVALCYVLTSRRVDQDGLAAQRQDAHLAPVLARSRAREAVAAPEA